MIKIWVSSWLSNFIPHFIRDVINFPCQDLIGTMLIMWAPCDGKWHWCKYWRNSGKYHTYGNSHTPASQNKQYDAACLVPQFRGYVVVDSGNYLLSCVIERLRTAFPGPVIKRDSVTHTKCDRMRCDANSRFRIACIHFHNHDNAIIFMWWYGLPLRQYWKI